ncbi:DUF4184 family protein [Massilia sp. CCM 8734]|nr:DUF4184 family protein [Massilia sp. CCM 8734]
MAAARREHAHDVAACPVCAQPAGSRDDPFVAGHWRRATHIAWDAFAHPDTIPVNYFAALRERVSLGGDELPVFKVLQHGSSLLGVIVMATCTFA